MLNDGDRSNDGHENVAHSSTLPPQQSNTSGPRMARIRGSIRPAPPCRSSLEHAAHSLERSNTEKLVSIVQLSPTEQPRCTDFAHTDAIPHNKSTENNESDANVLQESGDSHETSEPSLDNEFGLWETWGSRWLPGTRNGFPAPSSPSSPSSGTTVTKGRLVTAKSLARPSDSTFDQKYPHKKPRTEPIGGRKKEQSALYGLPPAPHEAYEALRAKEFQSYIEEDDRKKGRQLSISMRANKPFDSWDDKRAMQESSRKKAIATIKKQNHAFELSQSQHLSAQTTDHQTGFALPSIFSRDHIRSALTEDDDLGKSLMSHPIDRFEPSMSIQDQERGVKNRTPDPHPQCPVRRSRPSRVPVATQPKRSPARPFLSLKRHSPLQKPLDASTAREMASLFDFDRADKDMRG